MKTVWAKITFQKEGMHYYPSAPGNVAYLRNKHRHMFHFTVWIEQYHDNRDIEYLTWKNILEENCSVGDVGMTSCEMLADRTIAFLRTKLGNCRRMKVEVTEDGENGALVEYDFTPDGALVEYDITPNRA